MGKESMVLRDVMAWLHDNNHWFERLPAGSAFVPGGVITKQRPLGTKPRRIRMGRKGAPDVIAGVNGLSIGIETKRDEKEYKKWIGVIDRYKKATGGEVNLNIKWDNEMLLYPDIKKSWEHEVDQYKYAVKMTKRGSKYILTYSVEHLEAELKKIKDKYKIK